LSAIIFVLPGLVMIGWWHGFPYWMTMAATGLGGILGVMFSVPLRRALVVNGDLPYPEGRAAAEVLLLGDKSHGGNDEENRQGLLAITVNALASAAFFALSQTRLVVDEAALYFRIGAGSTGASASLSMALFGVGHLVGLSVGMAMLVGWVVVLMAASTQIDLTSQVKNILPGANGGTGNGYLTFAGPSGSGVTWTGPNSSVTLLTSGSAVTVAEGGTSLTSMTAHGTVVGEGTSAPNLISPSANGQCYMSASSNYGTTDPSFQSCPSAANQNQGAPSGSINGSNTSFSLSPTPAASSNVNCFLNGVQQRQGSGADYTISGATITYNTAPASGSTLNCLWY